jgi:hypothetical protein
VPFLDDQTTSGGGSPASQVEDQLHAASDYTPKAMGAGPTEAAVATSTPISMAVVVPAVSAPTVSTPIVVTNTVAPAPNLGPTTFGHLNGRFASYTLTTMGSSTPSPCHRFLPSLCSSLCKPHL